MDKTPFQHLSDEERCHALRVAESAGSFPGFLLEKDIWVVATLGVLLEAPFGQQLVFKGGTSLSKVWRVIQRFSEDIDINYDIREIAPDLIGSAAGEDLPPILSQAKRWKKIVGSRLNEWIHDEAVPILDKGLAERGFAAQIRVARNRLFIAYDPLFDLYGTIRPEVLVDLSARSTGEPRETHTVTCEAARFNPGLAFPQARPNTMVPERIFWEKATAMHVYCLRGQRRRERWSRHWHDLVRLYECGVAERALADRCLALMVARHKALFYRTTDSTGKRIDYEAAVSGSLKLVPSGRAREELAADYGSMLAIEMLRDETEPFDAIMECSAAIEARANSLRAV